MRPKLSLKEKILLPLQAIGLFLTGLSVWALSAVMILAIIAFGGVMVWLVFVAVKWLWARA